MTEVERIWLAARPRVGPGSVGPGRRRPSAGISAVLLALRAGPTHGGEVARRAGQDQANTTAAWLPMLLERGFVRVVAEVRAGEVKTGGRAGGRPARVWALTARGRELVAVLEVSPR